jgi:RNA-directed DNA polymerase
MKKVRQRVKKLTDRSRNGVKDVRVLISDLSPILRGWGNYSAPGTPHVSFIQVDDYVRSRLRRFLMKRYGRNLHAGRADRWTEEWFNDLGLYRLRGTICYAEAA